MNKIYSILGFAAILVVVASAAYAVEGEEEVNHILELIRPVLDMIVGFIGDILNEFVEAIQKLFGLGNNGGGGSTPV